MARPTLEEILSGLSSWDTTINENNEKLAGQPLPMLLESSLLDLTNNFPPALYDACTAVVWDGTPGNPVYLYASTNSSWELITADILPPELGRLAECTLALGDIGAGAGALTPTNTFNVSSASKTNPNVNSDLVTVNFTTLVATPYQLVIEWSDASGLVTNIHAPKIISKAAGTAVFEIYEAAAGVQNGTVKVLILDTTKV